MRWDNLNRSKALSVQVQNESGESQHRSQWLPDLLRGQNGDGDLLG